MDQLIQTRQGRLTTTISDILVMFYVKINQNVSQIVEI